nr:NTP transferase domain-containing protein [Saprospiraceae bacterium]
MDTTLLVLAAGMGSRYGGLKQLDTFGPESKTIMDYSVEDAIQAGFSKVVFVIREEFEEDFYRNISSRFVDRIEVVHVFQKLQVPGFEVEREKPWGTGHAILAAVEVIKEPFAVINADDFYGKHSYLQAHSFLVEQASGTEYGMVAFVLKNTLSPYGAVSRGVCEVDEKFQLHGVEEHTQISQTNGDIKGLDSKGLEKTLLPQTLVSMNLWMFHQDIFPDLRNRFHQFVADHISDPKAEFYIPSFVDEKLKKGEVKVKVLPTNEKWYGVTYREDRERVNEALNQLHAKGVY